MSITPDEQERRRLFKESTARISKIWPDDAEIRLSRGHQEAHKRMDLTQEALNTAWLACQGDLADMRQFKAALADWETHRFNCVKILGKGDRKKWTK